MLLLRLLRIPAALLLRRRLIPAACLASGLYLIWYLHVKATLKISIPPMVDLPCTLPTLNPFHPSIMKYVDVVRHINCTSQTYPLLFKVDVETGELVLVGEDGEADCCYRVFRRGSKDREQVYEDHCHELNVNANQSRRRWRINHEYIAVYCKREVSGVADRVWNAVKWVATGSEYSLVDMFSFVVPMATGNEHEPSSSERKKPATENGHAPPNSSDRKNKPNILLLGLDSISHMNQIRTMPLSRDFLLRNLSAIEMHGQNLIEENTFTNIIPILTGMNEEELRTHCWPTPQTYFDSCDYIWSNYSSKGYMTSYGEDASNYGNFLYHKVGFRTQPTHYSTIPLVNALEKSRMVHRGDGPHSEQVCYGPRLGWEILFENVKKVAVRGRSESRPFFQFTWATSLAHSDNNYPGAGDGHLLDLLEWLQGGAYLNETVLIILSDHGSREGGLRETEQGAMEARMPFLYFVFPRWFREKYRVAIKNLVGNSVTRTTPFDVHELLVDLLDLGRVEDSKLIQRTRSELGKRGVSLFLPLPNPRSCFRAGIGIHACACKAPLKLNVQSSEVAEAAYKAVEEINVRLKRNSKCAQLKLSSIKSAHELYRGNGTHALRLTFETTPGSALFEVSIMRGENGWTIVGSISRLNLYGKQSACVDEYGLKNLCYCIE